MMTASRTTSRKPWLSHAACFLAGVVVAVAMMQFRAHKFPPAKPAAGDSGVVTNVSRPWGSLEALRIPFAASENIFADKPVRMQAPHWFFEGFSEAQVAALISSCNLRPDLGGRLLERSNWQVFSNGCLVLPPSVAVKGLAPEARRKLYETLAHSCANYAQQYPFRYTLGGFAEHFQEQGAVRQK